MDRSALMTARPASGWPARCRASQPSSTGGDRMFKRALFAVLFLAAAPLGAPPSRGIVSGPVGEKLDAYLTRLEGFGFAGSMLVAKDGQILLHKGYGLADREKGIPFTPETVFAIGSITKQFPAAA